MDVHMKSVQSYIYMWNVYQIQRYQFHFMVILNMRKQIDTEIIRDRNRKIEE